MNQSLCRHIPQSTLEQLDWNRAKYRPNDFARTYLCMLPNCTRRRSQILTTSIHIVDPSLLIYEPRDDAHTLKKGLDLSSAVSSALTKAMPWMSAGIEAFCESLNSGNTIESVLRDFGRSTEFLQASCLGKVCNDALLDHGDGVD